MKRLLISTLALFFSLSLWAVQYQIASVEYNIIGNFSTASLDAFINIDREKKFSNLNEFSQYLEDIESRLLNTRLCNKVEFDFYENTMLVWESYSNEETGEEIVIIPLYLLITIEETGNFIAAPYPKFDSNRGFEGKLKLRHNNFLGRMTMLDADVSYVYSIDKKHSAEAEVDFEIPFYIGMTKNSFYSNGNASYNFTDALFTTNSMAGLRFSLPISFFSMNLALEQHYLFDNFSYMKERIKFFVPFIIPVSIPLTITAETSVDYNWATETSFIHHVTVLPNVRIESSNMTWIENFQKGYDLRANAGIEYNITTKEIAPSISVTGILHYPLVQEGNISPSARLHAWYGTQSKERGSYIRGILDSDFAGSSGIVLNIDFTISLFQLYIDSLFQNDKLHIFNFELQLAPFTDVAFIFTPEETFDFTTGITMIIHPLSMKSIQGRISFGSNPLWAKNNSSLYELYIGLGLFY